MAAGMSGLLACFPSWAILKPPGGGCPREGGSSAAQMLLAIVGLKSRSLKDKKWSVFLRTYFYMHRELQRCNL